MTSAPASTGDRHGPGARSPIIAVGELFVLFGASGVLLAFAAVCVATGCAGRASAPGISRPNDRPAQPSTTPPEPRSREPDYRGFHVELPRLLSPELAEIYERWAHAADPRSMFLFREQAPPIGYRGIPTRQAKTFPSRAFSVIRGFRFGSDQTYPREHRFDRFVPGCGGGVLAKNGTLCPSVEYPGVTLSPAQAEELLSIINTPKGAPLAIMNGYHLVYGFVVYDGSDMPVAQALVTEHIDKLYTQPRLSDPFMGELGHGRETRLKALLGAVGFAVESTEEQDALVRRQAQLDGDLGRARYLPTSSGVDGARSMNDLSTAERARLCAWHQQVWALGLPRSGLETNGIRCEDGWAGTGLDWKACQEQLPACPANVGEVEACMRRQRFDPCLQRDVRNRCKALRGCFWGFVTTARLRDGPWTSPHTFENSRRSSKRRNRWRS
jgi:hypothetical protein